MKGKRKRNKHPHVLSKYGRWSKHLTNDDKADNRRKLLSKLDVKTREWVTRDFAKLGLYQ